MTSCAHRRRRDGDATNTGRGLEGGWQNSQHGKKRRPDRWTERPQQRSADQHFHVLQRS